MRKYVCDLSELAHSLFQVEIQSLTLEVAVGVYDYRPTTSLCAQKLC